uniref:AP complex subunit sigma n=1 Tax=Chromera velia CCMP2878 TaxID=1169474 RepID=A0A0G4FSY3_9ALVE|mmetsp:Transcript_35995/g.70824  ORF Transcript_35995/g.70824 Transcript_35995/m.70824 type:complete len:165 (+) Transcript_35995:312-806(+)|eukprot:Cvel_18477.t1-p1 / transcript=Cvel_18477.t1 / gene=Cvel_18477 / organism=Chromera_velia_CCMP2878 / gene_product=AP-1 complex subunit sigma-2, putative / transcript_product=AP-1 complex subunit sigma-2, putative / location=Cvel_scaffold1532:2580-4072(-) / protein_length=164 / sequence_SO=supercontig / SO=protein_coding / is_pseudo=false
MIHFLLLISRQGKTRLAKWFVNVPQKERQKTIKDVSHLILHRHQKLCNVIEWRENKLVYKRYASLYFVVCIDKDDNELLQLEVIHHYVELLDRYFGNVCELDLIFNFHKAYYILDELIICGELQESSKKAVMRIVAAQDALMDESKDSSSLASVGKKAVASMFA